MRLSTFAVKGYKNLRRTVTLESLDGFNVIHGENDVGKSNLLQAIDLFFGMVASMGQRSDTPIKTGALGEDDSTTSWVVVDGLITGVRFHISEQSLKSLGYAADDIFHVEEPSPITLEGAIDIGPDDWQLAGRPTAALEREHLRFRLSRSHAGCVDVEVASETGKIDSLEWQMKRDVASLISRAFSVRTAGETRSFSLVDVHRRVASVDAPDAGETHRIVPLSLLLGLYDAKESVEPGVFQRWEIFEEAMSSLGTLVDGGRFVITYNRAKGRAHLAVQKGRTRMPIESMGSGVQQIASLLARVLLGNASIVAIEEPEINLRYDLQIRLREMLRRVVDSGLGPRQVIISSHSPAFETGDAFYAMTMTAGGPVVERRPVVEAPAFLQMALGVQIPAERGAFGYVSSDGLLRLPSDIREVLGVPAGGGVVVMKRSGHEHVEVLSNEQFLNLLHGEGRGDDRG
jgi:predicted ATPase